jgi:sulfur carrier protein
LTITLNGEPFSVPGPLTIMDLLSRLEIDYRRVAVERNVRVIKRDAYMSTTIEEGDEIEIVNFVGGGSEPLSILDSRPSDTYDF